MTSDAMSAGGIKAQMPHPILPRVFCKPTHKQIKTVICKLLANLMAISCPWGHSKGHLGLLQDPAIYLAHNREAFNIPHIEPPAYPVIPAGATTANHEDIRATNATACKAWNTPILNDVYYAILDNPTKGINTVNLRTLVIHILNTYTQISQLDLDDNMTNFHSGIDSGLPFAIYTRKQEKCEVFAANADVPMSEKTMITTGTKHAMACGNMMLAWCKWKLCPLIHHTWPNWKAHWMAVFAKMRNINCMTASNTAFGANQAAKLDQAQQMASSLNNMANMTIQKNTTIKNLVATNATLTKAITNIQLSITQMCATGIPISPALTAPVPLTNARFRLSYWSNTKPAWNKFGYCWMCGYKVNIGHTSATCTLRKTSHQPGATRANMMGGSTHNVGYPTTTKSST
jgi:hypothetical protein